MQLQPQTQDQYMRQQCWGLTVSGVVWGALSAVTQGTNFVVLCIAFSLCVCELLVTSKYDHMGCFQFLACLSASLELLLILGSGRHVCVVSYPNHILNMAAAI